MNPHAAFAVSRKATRHSPHLPRWRKKNLSMINGLLNGAQLSIPAGAAVAVLGEPSATELGIVGGVVVLATLALQVAQKAMASKGGAKAEAAHAQLIEEIRELTASLKGMSELTEQIWRWHAPDDHGVQSWKNPRIEKLLEDILDEARRR